MSSNDSSLHIMDEFPEEMQLASKAVEFLILPLFLGYIIAMFKGVEINHPGMIKPDIRQMLQLDCFF
jgi:hypothetical protein